ncbi:MAG: FkbM family methyltransferase [Ardenticatenales bacterium]|nr:FkbM family methyltransferase [Ardenticatenales bacterium]
MSRLKHLFMSFITIHPVNKVLRVLVRPVADKLPFSFPITGTIDYRLPNGKVVKFVNDGRDSHATRLYWDNETGFEPETISVYLELLRHARVVFDVGANVGIYSLIAAVNDPQCSVHGFEPVPFIYAYYARNVQANKLQNLQPNQAAVTTKSGEITLYIPDSVQLPSDASTVEGYREGVVPTQVKAVSLDEYAAEHKLARVDLMKVDAEGAEHQVFAGAQTIMERDKPAIICEILHGFVDENVKQFFADHNYRYFLVTDDGLVEHQEIIGDKSFRYKNYLFIPEERIPTMLANIPVQRMAEFV